LIAKWMMPIGAVHPQYLRLLNFYFVIVKAICEINFLQTIFWIIGYGR